MKNTQKMSTEKQGKSLPTSSSKLGIWYVCKRCCEPFPTPSAIDRHQSRKRKCKRQVIVTESSQELCKVRYLKALVDNDHDVKRYMCAMLNRGNSDELIDVLDACPIVDFEILLRELTELSKNPRNASNFLNFLAHLSDYSNRSNISLERKMRLKAYVEEHITL